MSSKNMLNQRTVKLGSYVDKPVLGACHDIQSGQGQRTHSHYRGAFANLDYFIPENDRYNLTRDATTTCTTRTGRICCD